MIVDDFHVRRAGGRPAETDAELIVHSDAVLTQPVTLEDFKPVAGRNTEVFDPGCDLQLPQLAPRHILNFLEPPDPAPVSESLGVSILERCDQLAIVMHRVINVKRVERKNRERKRTEKRDT